MRKLFWVLILCLIATSAFAATRVQPRNYTGDVVITTSPAVIVDASVYFKGVTVGDSIVLYNRATSTGIGTTNRVLTFYADTANGRRPLINVEGFTCDTGIYMDSTISGGVMGIDIIYQ